MEEYIYEHPILHLRNTTDTGVGASRHVCKISPKEKKNFVRKAHRKMRRMVRDALKGNEIRCNKRPGDSWSLY